MRSRYTAFVRGDMGYLAATHDPATRAAFDPVGTGAWAGRVRWLGLTVQGTQAGGPGDAEGRVTFVARFEEAGRPGSIREDSRFRRLDGRWVYVDGRAPAAVGRNAPCPCGSGRKFKQCCGK